MVFKDRDLFCLLVILSVNYKMNSVFFFAPRQRLLVSIECKSLIKGTFFLWQNVYIYTCTWNFFVHLKGHTCTCSHSCTEDIKIYYYWQFWRNKLNVRVLIAMIFVYLDYMYHMLFWETDRERERKQERERERGERERNFFIIEETIDLYCWRN